MSSELSREELSAAVAARQELGAEYEPALVDSLAERVEQVVQARVQAQRQAQPVRMDPVAVMPPMPAWARVSIAGASLVAAIPCSILAVINAGVPGLVVTWAGVALVNVAAALGPRR